MSEFTAQIAKYHDEAKYGKLFVGKSIHEILRQLADLHMLSESRILAENAKLEVKVEELTDSIGKRGNEEADKLVEKNKEIKTLTDHVAALRLINKELRQQLADSKGLTNAKAIK